MFVRIQWANRSRRNPSREPLVSERAVTINFFRYKVWYNPSAKETGGLKAIALVSAMSVRLRTNPHKGN